MHQVVEFELIRSRSVRALRQLRRMRSPPPDGQLFLLSEEAAVGYTDELLDGSGNEL